MAKPIPCPCTLPKAGVLEMLQSRLAAAHDNALTGMLKSREHALKLRRDEYERAKVKLAALKKAPRAVQLRETTSYATSKLQGLIDILNLMPGDSVDLVQDSELYKAITGPLC